MYNVKDQQRRVKQEKIIDQIADAHRKHEKAEIFDDHDDEDNRDQARFNDAMRETKTGFGGKNNYQVEGGLEHEEEDSDEEDDDDVEGDAIEDDDGEDDDEASDHNF